MKNNVYMLLCMLTALGGHTPAQCAQQTSNSSASWALPAFVGTAFGFFLGSWFMRNSLKREINSVRAESAAYETQNNITIRGIVQRQAIHAARLNAHNRRITSLGIGTATYLTGLHNSVNDASRLSLINFMALNQLAYLPRAIVNVFFHQANNQNTHPNQLD